MPILLRWVVPLVAWILPIVTALSFTTIVFLAHMNDLGTASLVGHEYLIVSDVSSFLTCFAIIAILLALIGDLIENMVNRISWIERVTYVETIFVGWITLTVATSLAMLTFLETPLLVVKGILPWMVAAALVSSLPISIMLVRASKYLVEDDAQAEAAKQSKCSIAGMKRIGVAFCAELLFFVLIYLCLLIILLIQTTDSSLLITKSTIGVFVGFAVIAAFAIDGILALGKFVSPIPRLEYRMRTASNFTFGHLAVSLPFFVLGILAETNGEPHSITVAPYLGAMLITIFCLFVAGLFFAFLAPPMSDKSGDASATA